MPLLTLLAVGENVTRNLTLAAVNGQSISLFNTSGASSIVPIPGIQPGSLGDDVLSRSQRIRPNATRVNQSSETLRYACSAIPRICSLSTSMG
ncbi:hypothetical protein T4C_406 [Trichinella pseudospiralis]|uniref:Uncharacterized protein n=1 Tax=Trichinella pseudospiralis TaxID=6337 RepID=A0A0V1JDR5_TRIPS|nr:hypothetical protein T4C_406 [Trichinella pseudospiralis]